MPTLVVRRRAWNPWRQIERRRRPDEIDHLRWYCAQCHAVLHDAAFACEDLATQLKPIIEAFYADAALRTCRTCGTVLEPPPAPGA